MKALEVSDEGVLRIRDTRSVPAIWFLCASGLLGASMKVGFIGLGRMGSAVARNIQRTGHRLTVYDLRREAAATLIEHGAAWADSSADTINQADVVVTMVYGPKQIAQVVRGERGLLSSNCRGKVWIDCTTSSPVLMRDLAHVFEEAGGLAVDAPVTGSMDSAIRGDMIMFVGGTESAVTAARPILETMGQIRRVGPYGNGYVAKLVNNQLWKIHAAAIGEAMVMAKKAGLEPEVW